MFRHGCFSGRRAFGLWPVNLVEWMWCFMMVHDWEWWINYMNKRKRIVPRVPFISFRLTDDTTAEVCHATNGRASGRYTGGQRWFRTRRPWNFVFQVVAIRNKTGKICTRQIYESRWKNWFTVVAIRNKDSPQLRKSVVGSFMLPGSCNSTWENLELPSGCLARATRPSEKV